MKTETITGRIVQVENAEIEFEAYTGSKFERITESERIEMPLPETPLHSRMVKIPSMKLSIREGDKTLEARLPHHLLPIEKKVLVGTDVIYEHKFEGWSESVIDHGIINQYKLIRQSDGAVLFEYETFE